ncbi:peptidoglycan recognition family protein [Paludisphaera borealis]|uniref:N-acetylmuramoyl-L-alanine amidase n=1 Tax=Paludisphaera borealis TaxID=1387353 RepID=A0A1U7CVR7_9BACT|nr:peptidoglycan recognition family protein [Paludisphaera borealis]APW63021.1 hypothetical protein BSF38_04579 [Paludisphaera borealis]
MALKQSAPIAVRAGKAWVVAAVAGALLTTAGGCNHRRSALRPVFSGVRAAAAPCTNCGGDGGSTTVVTDPGTTIIRGGSAPGGLSREPISSEPGASIPSDVPALDEPIINTTPTSRKSASPETPPKATIGDPDLDSIPSATSTSRSRSLRPSYDSNSKSNAKSSPALQGPGSSAPTSYKTKVDGGLRSTSTTGVVRRTSAQDGLKTFFGKDGGDELFFPNKADRPWKYVVLHHSATETGNYDSIDAEHRKVLGFDGCGYHFVIGNGTGSGDGQIEVSQRWVNQKHGVHCRNARKAEIDEYGIGICFIGDFDKAPPTARQVAAARALVSYLSRKYEIVDENVETHAHLAATPTVCPGKHFPFESILAAPSVNVQEDRPARERRPVPTAWKVKAPSSQGQGGTPVY